MKFIATGFGSGWMPWAPGTFGSLVGLLLAWGLHFRPIFEQLAGIVGMVMLGVYVCGRAAQLYGMKDPGKVTWDEVCAMPIVFLAVPFTWLTAVAGFALFRLFDISKPWPARRLEFLPGGWGIMADDLAAAAYSAVVLTTVVRLGWLPGT